MIYLKNKEYITIFDRYVNRNIQIVINGIKSYLKQEQVVEPKKDIQPQEPQQKTVVELVVDNTKSLYELTEDVVEEIGIHSVELPLDCAIIILQSVQDIMTQDINKTTIKAVLQSKLTSITEIVSVIKRAKIMEILIRVYQIIMY